MKDRAVKYRSLLAADSSTVRVAPLWAFIFELGYFNAMNCGLIPPRACLNSFLNAGRSIEASWEPFEISEDEYAALEAQLLKPDLDTLSKYSQNDWQTFGRDPSLDHFNDLAQWQQKVKEKNQQEWGSRMAQLQHQIVMRRGAKG